MADLSKASTLRPPQSAALNTAQRKPTPSPLQVSSIPTPITDNFVQSSPQELGSPYSARGSGNSLPLHSPNSPLHSPASVQEQSDSKNHENLMPQPLRHATQDSLRPSTSGDAKSSPQATPRGNGLPIRNLSAPITPSSTSEHSAYSPPDIVSPKNRTLDHRPIERLGPRTSSIDSTMSSVSSTTSHSQASTDPLSPNPVEIAQLIAAAGSAEALIRQLVKEKRQAAAQNAQLWRLINKQRSLVIGLNADLARTIEEKEKYQRRYKDLSTSMRAPSMQSIERLRRAPSANSSPARSEDNLPIQRHSILANDARNPEHVRSVSAGRELEMSSGSRPMTTVLQPKAASEASSSNTSPSFSSEVMPKATPESAASDEEEDSRRNTIMQTHFKPIAPLEIHKKMGPVLDTASVPQTPPIQTDLDPAPSPSSFAARRSVTNPRKVSKNSPQIGAESPKDSKPASLLPRKGPPPPLNLPHKHSPHQQLPVPLPKSPDEYRPEDHSESEYDDVVEVDEIPAFERGRKKTRAEDDAEREYIMQKDAESRSQSKKQRPKSGSKSSKNPEASPAMSLPKSPAIQAFSPDGSPSSLQQHFSPHASLAGVLSGPSSSHGSIIEQTASAPPLSPGLPRSPRPIDRPPLSPIPRAPIEASVTSPPLSPGGNSLSPPTLSPRLPRHPIPLPPQTPTSVASSTQRSADDNSVTSKPRSPALQPPLALSPRSPKSPAKALSPESGKSPLKSTAPEPLAPVSSNTSSETISGGIYRGLVSEAYPDLLLPPNALPSILIKITSSRLRPSRNSILSVKGLEEDPVFTLGVTARSSMKQLWRVEKPILALPQLDQQLRQASNLDIKLPDRSLFMGHAPAKIDARREALEKYFEEMLDTPMNEKAGLIVCQFLSSQVVPVEDHDSGMKGTAPKNSNHPVHLGPDGRIIKEGYLTKRGKNFGGWKARYFVLDEPTLRYYDSPGGSLTGQIKLTHAQIGRQSTQSAAAHSPSRNAEDSDKEFRHAFLILEPKKKDSGSVLRHVLCAESDQERDEWVTALLQYIGQPASESKSKSSSTRGLLHMMKSKEESPARTERRREESDVLQGVSYEDTVQGQPVRTGLPKEAPSPLTGSFNSNHGYMQPGTKQISGPSGGAVIQDATSWGNKAPESPKSRDKDQVQQKKRSLWGFRDKVSDTGSAHSGSSQASVTKPLPSSLAANPRPVFGMPLAEAVETYPARGAEIALPAVVYRCLEYLESKDAASEEGIFRLSGSNLTIKALKDKFNNEGDFDFLADSNYFDVHAVASLLKLYLRELPSTVLGSRELHLQFLQVLELEDRNKKIAAYNVLVHRLPPANWTLIRALSAFLIGIVSNSNINKMTVRNVGIVFSPTLSIPAPVFAAFLTDFDSIFTTDPVAESLAQIVQGPPRAPSNGPASASLRSPKNAAFSDIFTPTHPEIFSQRNGSHSRSATPDRAGSAQVHYPTQHNRKISREEPAGYVPMIPAYENQSYMLPPQQSIPENPTQPLYPPQLLKQNPNRESVVPNLASTGLMRDAKARRRESSMMMLNMGAGQRKSSMPTLRNPVDMLYDEENIRI